MTVAAIPPSRVVLTGFVFAVALTVYTTTLFVLALVVFSQGLPQDYDTAETETVEALAVIRLTLLGFLVCPSLFSASIACISFGAGSSRGAIAFRALSGVLLVVSLVFGLVGLRIWGGFGW